MGRHENDRPIDLLVIGGGMAGLTAAARVVDQGGCAVVVERAPELGGSARLAGYLHTAADADDLFEADPGADAPLQRQLVEGFPAAVEWVRTLGVDCGPEVPVLRLTRGHLIATDSYVDVCGSIVANGDGSTVILGATTSQLIVEDESVRGAIVTSKDGEHELRARWTLLATGGFQGDAQLVGERIHSNGAAMQLRSNPYSRGEGLRLAMASGADSGPAGAMFYGHLVPSGVAFADPADYTAFSQYHSDHGLLFNIDGRRFVDETLGDHVNATFTVEQPEGRALLVVDQRVRNRWMLTPLVEGMPPPVDRFELARKRGGRVGVANDVDEFQYLPEDWGFPGAVIAESLHAYNDAARRGLPLVPSRRLDATPLVDPPYYVMDVSAAITFTYGGVRIDSSARVLDPNGRPVPGLLAAGADAGGTFSRDYAGGLANAAVFGLRAAQTVLGSSH